MITTFSYHWIAIKSCDPVVPVSHFDKHLHELEYGHFSDM